MALAIELRCAIESERLRKFVLPVWNKSRQARSYEHEILAIAPVAEPPWFRSPGEASARVLKIAAMVS